MDLLDSANMPQFSQFYFSGSEIRLNWTEILHHKGSRSESAPDALGKFDSGYNLADVLELVFSKTDHF